jgi:hypothetical protein
MPLSEDFNENGRENPEQAIAYPWFETPPRIGQTQPKLKTPRPMFTLDSLASGRVLFLIKEYP